MTKYVVVTVEVTDSPPTYDSPVKDSYTINTECIGTLFSANSVVVAVGKWVVKVFARLLAEAKGGAFIDALTKP